MGEWNKDRKNKNKRAVKNKQASFECIVFLFSYFHNIFVVLTEK